MPSKERQKKFFAGDVVVKGKLTATESGKTFVLDAIENEAAADLPIKTGVSPVTSFNVKDVASAVNYLGSKPAIATAGPELVAEGSDTNIDIKLTPKGTGSLTTAAQVKQTATAITATSDGLTTGLIALGVAFVEITATTNDIVRPPVGAPGDVIRGHIGSNGCEIRTILANSAKINDIVCADTKEAAIPADTTFELRCHTAEEWILIAWTKLGAVITAIVPDAV